MKATVVIFLLLCSLSNAFAQKQTTLLQFTGYFMPFDSAFVATKENTQELGIFMDSLYADIFRLKIPLYNLGGSNAVEDTPHIRIKDPNQYFYKLGISTSGTPIKINYKTRVQYQFQFKGETIDVNKPKDKKKARYYRNWTNQYRYEGKLVKSDAWVLISETEYYFVEEYPLRMNQTYSFAYIKMSDIRKRGYKIKADGREVLVADYLLDENQLFKALAVERYKFLKGGPGGEIGNNTYNDFYIVENKIKFLDGLELSFPQKVFEEAFLKRDFYTLIGCNHIMEHYGLF